MKLEESEKLLVEELYQDSMDEFKLGELVSVNKLTGDASSRRYYRIDSSTSPYVVCLDEPLEIDSDFYTVQKLLKNQNVKVPSIIDYKRDKGYFLEQDLGDQTLLSKLGVLSDDDILKSYKVAIDELVKMQSISTDKLAGTPVTSRSFDVEKLMFEVRFANKYFLKDYLGYSLNSNFEKIIEKEFAKICAYLESRVKVFCHRDYHSRNIMIYDNDLFVIDFQDARMGTVSYDLVSLLDDCYFSIGTKTVEKLKRYYIECISNSDIYDEKWFETFEKEYDLQLVQRAYKAIGSFSYIYKSRNDVRYLKYIGFAFEKIRQTLMKYPEYTELNKVLCELYYES